MFSAYDSCNQRLLEGAVFYLWPIFIFNYAYQMWPYGDIIPTNTAFKEYYDECDKTAVLQSHFYNIYFDCPAIVYIQKKNEKEIWFCHSSNKSCVFLLR